MKTVSIEQVAIALAKLYNGTAPGDEMWSELDYEALEFALEHPIERLYARTQPQGCGRGRMKTEQEIRERLKDTV